MNDLCKNIEPKISIVFDDMISDMLSNKNINSIVTELSIRDGKCNTFLVFNT